MRFNRLAYQILLVFVLVIVVCLGVSGWFVTQFSENIVTRKISEGDRNFAGRIAQQVAAEMASVKPTLTLLAESTGLRRMKATEVKGEIDRVQRSFPDITSIYVADLEGEQIARTGTEELWYTIEPENVSRIWSFQVARGGDELVSDIYLKPATSEPMQTITLPIIDNEAVVGVLSADICFTRIMVSVMDIYIGKTGNVVVVADNGRVVAHTRMKQVPELDLSRLPAVEAVLAGEEGAMKGYTDELGRQVVGSYMPIRELGWGVIIQRPLADIDAEVGQLRTTIILVMIAAVLLTVAAGWLMSRQITKPIRQLASASERVSQGDLSTPVDVKSSNEVGVLAHSFNQMIVSLKKSRDELQQWGEELRKSEEKYRTLTENVNIGIYRVTPGPKGNFIEVNPALVKILGYKNKKEVLSINVADIYQSPKERKKFSDKVIGQGFVIGEELQLKKKDGTPLIASVSAVIVRAGETGVGRDDAGNILYFDGIMEDITERKRVEEELRKHREHLEELVKERTSELEQRGQELADINVSLEEMSRHKSQFLANMSHELRTPLNSIIGYTKLMLDGLEGDINEEQQQDLHTVYTNSKHLLELINGLLDLSRIEAGKIVLTYETFSISDFLSEVIPTIEPLTREKGLTLTYSVAPDIDRLYADKAKTKQVLINILGNAVKFTDEGSVKLDVAESDSDFIFSVTDTGMGMKKEDLEAIFESFKQVGPAQIAGYEGTGLGLAISKQFIEMQGGRIWAESEPGKGTTFTFTLPKKVTSS